jgi:hypothetical protein
MQGKERISRKRYHRQRLKARRLTAGSSSAAAAQASANCVFRFGGLENKERFVPRLGADELMWETVN